jgi:hypothetical protein
MYRLYIYIYINIQSASLSPGPYETSVILQTTENCKEGKLLQSTCFWSQVLDFFNIEQAVMVLESLHINSKILPDDVEATPFDVLRIR